MICLRVRFNGVPLRVDRRIWLVGLSLTTVEIGNRPLGWWDWSLSSPLLMLVKV